MASPKTRPLLDELHAYVPGKSVEEVKAHWQLDHVIKIASNENSLGASPKALAALARELGNVHRYPLGHSPELTRAMAVELGIDANQLFFSNGSDEAIWLLCSAYLNAGERVLASASTFSEYQFCTRLLEGRFEAVAPREGYHDLDAFDRALLTPAKLVFLCNPNNPTGTCVPRARLERFLDQVAETTLVVVDQAYSEYADAADYADLVSDTSGRRNLVLLRTFSKVYGLAGLRIGYAISHPEVIAALYKVKQPFSVNRLAQVAALAALHDHEFVARTLELNELGKRFLYAAFESLGIETLPTQANYIAAHIGARAPELCSYLEQHGLIVRLLASFDMPEWIRVTVGLEHENQRFAELLQAFTAERPSCV